MFTIFDHLRVQIQVSKIPYHHTFTHLTSTEEIGLIIDQDKVNINKVFWTCIFNFSTNLVCFFSQIIYVVCRNKFSTIKHNNLLHSTDDTAILFIGWKWIGCFDCCFKIRVDVFQFCWSLEDLQLSKSRRTSENT